MGLKNLPLIIDRIIYDPIKGRVLYDAVFSLGSTILIFLLFIIFGNLKINLLFPFLYPTIFIIFNFILGLYGKNKTSSLFKKIQILFESNFVAFAVLVLLTSNYLFVTVVCLICLITSVLPRIFLNFNIERISFNKISSNDKSGPVLIVGGGGYIGTVLVEELLKRNEKVRVFDKFIYGKGVFKGMRNIKNLEIIEGDISDVYRLTLAVKGSKSIVHLAGIVGDPAARIDEKLTRHVNIASTRLLKETAKAFDVGKFIFASSCSVYGFSDKIQNEKTKPKPISLYAKTKVDSEKELLSDTSDNFHPTILRFATVFGHSRKPRFDLVANLFAAEAFNNKKINVYGGKQWRPFIHVKDIAKAIILVLDSNIDKTSRQIFNVGDDSLNTTIENLAEIIKNSSNDPKLKINLISKKKDKRNYRVSFRKIKSSLGYESSVTLENGITEILEKFKSGKYKKSYKSSYYVNSEMTKELKKEFRSKKYKKSHFSTMS